MEKQKNSDIEVVAKFKGIGSAEGIPDFEFQFYTELHQNETYTCSKTGDKLANCTVTAFPDLSHKLSECRVKCIIENHNFKPGRLCVLAHIKWPDRDFGDGVNNDMYREKLELYIRN
jgi:hypothetical protein